MGINARGARQPAPNDDDPIYSPSQWYMLSQAQIGAGALLAANVLALLPFQIRRRVAIQTLGGRITTLAAGGSIQFGIYGANLTTNLPFGQPLIRTASMATDAAGLVSSPALDKTGAAVAPSGIALDRGLYWFGVNADVTAGGVVIMQTYNGASGYLAWLTGAAAQASLSSSATAALFAKTVACTFGAWPDLTGVALTETVNQGHAAGQFQVAAGG